MGQLQPGGDACALCLALDGIEVAAQPHENCMCQIVDDDDNCSFEFSGSSDVPYGDGPYEQVFYAEIEVTCPNGETIGMTIPIDMGPFDPGGGGDIFDWLDGAAAAEADALCEQCPEPGPFLCC